MAEPEILRLPPIPVFGQLDENGMYHTFETPEYNLFVEAVGTDGQVHMSYARISTNDHDDPQILEKMLEMLDRVLENRMRDLGVWE